jgi:hypothetical protein
LFRVSWARRWIVQALLAVSLIPELASQDASTINPANHYIVLVDSSGSARRQMNYHRATTEILPHRLLKTGFPNIPPFVPSRDLISIVCFGVDAGDPSTAYLRLQNHDLTTELIHPVVIAETIRSARELNDLLTFRTRYSLTVLAWSMPMAVWATRVTRRPRKVYRTFLITLHDGTPNDGSAAEELRLIHRFGNPRNVDLAAQIVSNVESKYRFVGDGADGTATAESIRSGTQSLFLEAYEVRPRDSPANTGRAPLAITSELDEFGYQGDAAARKLSGRLSKRMAGWLAANGIGDVRVQMASSSAAVDRSTRRFELPVQDSGRCRAPQERLTILGWRWVPDRILGTRLVKYSDSALVDLPEALRCRAVAWGTVAGAIGFLVAAGFWTWHRFVATDLIVIAAGVAPLRLRRRRKVVRRSDTTFRDGSGPLIIKAPNAVLRALCYSGARLRLQNAVWSKTGTEIFPLRSLSGRFAEANWVPGEDRTVKLSLEQAAGFAEFEIRFAPRSQTMDEEKMPVRDNIQHYVALDLGSESMAAYHFDLDRNQGRAIDLQEFAGADPMYRNFRPRLRTRIQLREYKHAAGQPQLSFVTNGTLDRDLYQQSVFELFLSKQSHEVFNFAMPNPKIAFQRGAENLIPELRQTEGLARVRYKPEELICWLTTQIINNLVLPSSNLREVPRGAIYLILTVPNIYSITHVETLKRFVAENIPGLGGITVVFESDAVAYYPLAPTVQHQHPELGRFARTLQECIENMGRAYVVTFDMGRGTTDLSLCELFQTSAFGLRSLAHTGRSDGGSKLTYIFAKYFDAQIKKVLPPGLPSLLERAGGGNPRHEAAVENLEAYVEEVKRCITAKWDIEESAMLKSVREQLASSVVQTSTGGLARQQDLVEALTLPTLKKRLLLGYQSAEIEKLKLELERYIDANVTTLLRDLRAMAEANSREEGSEAAEVTFDVGNSVAIVAGQAAQFQPVSEALRRGLDNEFAAKGKQVVWLNGPEAKLCCSEGAVELCRRRLRIESADLITGTYGLMDPFGHVTWFTLSPNCTTTSPDAKDNPYDLVFAPKPKAALEMPDENSERRDGSNAITMITSVEPENGRFTIVFNPEERALYVNRKKVALGTYTVPENIYEQVWPEVRKTAVVEDDVSVVGVV